MTRYRQPPLGNAGPAHGTRYRQAGTTTRRPSRPVGPLVHAPRLARALPLLCAFVLASGLWFAGYDSAMGRAVSCIVSMVMMVALLVLLPPPTSLPWRRMIVPLCCAMAALAWLVAVRLLFPAQVLAPDLFAAGLLARIGALAVLLSAVLISFQPGMARAVTVRFALLAGFGFAVGIMLFIAERAGASWDMSVIRSGRLTGLVQNANVLATCAGVVLLITLGRFLEDVFVDRGRRPRHGSALVHGGLVLLCAATILLTGSRFVVVATCALALGLGYVATRRSRIAVSARTGLGLLVALLVIVLFSFADPFVERLSGLDADSAIRGEIWSIYARVAFDAPLLGHGIGSFPTINGMYAPSPERVGNTLNANSPHNLALQLLLVGGWPYLLLLGSAAVFIARAFIPGRGGRSVKAGRTAMIAAIALILAESMIDIALDVPAVITIALFMTGLLWGEALGPELSRRAAGAPPR